MNATVTKTRKPLKPVQVETTILRSLSPLGDGTDLNAPKIAIIDINAKQYIVRQHMTAYELTGHDDDGNTTTYYLPLDLTSCCCPDAIWRSERPGGCKHQVAMRDVVAK